MTIISRDAIVAHARAWCGTPYHHQQSCKAVGTDCLGLVRGLWRELYGREPESPPPYTRDWAEAAGQETLLDAARRHFVEIAIGQADAGDIIAFRLRKSSPSKHVGVLTGRTRMIHAMEGQPVSEHELSPWWVRRIDAAFAFPGVAPAPSFAPPSPSVVRFAHSQLR